MRFALAAAALLGLAFQARAQSFPARTGEAGILDVPDAEVVGLGGGQAAVDFGFDRVPGRPDDFGPLPFYAVAGLAPVLDLGITMRETGQPGDPRPASFLFGAALKLRLWEPHGFVPGAATSLVVDRVNGRGVLGGRIAFSTERRALRLAAFVGGEGEDSSTFGVTAGGALSIALSRRFELAAEAITGPRGDNFGAAVRFALGPTVGMAIGGNFFPDDDTVRIAVTLALSPARKRIRVAEEPALVEAPAAPGPERPVAFADGRPRFRLRVPVRGPALLADARHVQHGPPTARTAAASAPGLPRLDAGGVRAAAPSLEDLAEAQIREQEALADARERRIRVTSEQLEARERAAREEQKRLEEAEQALVAREQQIDARERRLPSSGAPSQQVRQLESVEAQLASQERSLSAQERSYIPALDAAQGRERDAAAREDAERQEANRLAASASAATTRALQLEIRKQASAARNRQLAALEARLVARGEWIDSIERQLRTKAERLDAWLRRLDTRNERLDLLERRTTEPKAPTAVPPPTSVGEAPAKDKAVFVMVVKSPTAIVKERPTAPAPAPSSALHPGVAVEKAVAAATVVMFPSPETQLSDLDRETLDNIAKLAARERCEILIWARAKDPGLMAEAQRRAAEIRSLVTTAGMLDTNQVVTRITTRPGAQGVDVVVSALRETAKPAAAPEAPQRAAGALLSGESGRRQLREAVQAAQKSIEACIGDLLEARRLTRAEGVLKLTVSQRGQVTRVATGDGDISGTEVEECLNSAARDWLFPPAEGEYVVDVPITLIRGGTK